VLPNTDPPAGFSIDLWNEVARRLRVDVTLQLVAAEDRLAALERGEADVAIGLIVMTPEDEKRVDFSTSYFDSGLQIMARARREGRFLDAFHSIPWAAIGELFGVAILIIGPVSESGRLGHGEGGHRCRRALMLRSTAARCQSTTETSLFPMLEQENRA